MIFLHQFYTNNHNTAANINTNPTISTNKMSLGIKEIVSKNKLRYKEDGFDLDLSYIARNIIAMGFPAETLERFYRNSINDVAKFFESRHKNHYKIYNLCSETKRRYDKTKFNGMVEDKYSFQDHNPPPFHKLKPFCENVHEWLSKDPNNVAAIHCKAGKGRTGVMICAYLLYAGQCEDKDGKIHKIIDAEAALEYYGLQRTRDLKGVTIPSQKRYVYYYEYLVKNQLQYQPIQLRLSSLILTSLPVYNGGAFTLICEIYQIPKQKIESFEINVKKGSKNILFPFEPEIFLKGDIKFEFFIKKMKKEKIFQFCFNTFFVAYGTDTYTVITEGCSVCPKGEKVASIVNNQKTHPKFEATNNSSNNNDNHQPNNHQKQQQQPNQTDETVIDLSFLELVKNSNMFLPCDCNSSSTMTSSSNNLIQNCLPLYLNNFDTITTNNSNKMTLTTTVSNASQPQQQQQPETINPEESIAFLQSKIPSITNKSSNHQIQNDINEISFNNNNNNVSSCTPTSSSSSNCSSTQSLCKKVSSPDLNKTIANMESKNLYLVLPKEKLDKAYKDKANKSFPGNLKIILQFSGVDDQSFSYNNNNFNFNNNSLDQKTIDNSFNSESENITSEDDDEDELLGQMISDSCPLDPRRTIIFNDNNHDNNNQTIMMEQQSSSSIRTSIADISLTDGNNKTFDYNNTKKGEVVTYL